MVGFFLPQMETSRMFRSTITSGAYKRLFFKGSFEGLSVRVLMDSQTVEY